MIGHRQANLSVSKRARQLQADTGAQDKPLRGYEPRYGAIATNASGNTGTDPLSVSFTEPCIIKHNSPGIDLGWYYAQMPIGFVPGTGFRDDTCYDGRSFLWPKQFKVPQFLNAFSTAVSAYGRISYRVRLSGPCIVRSARVPRPVSNVCAVWSLAFRSNLSHNTTIQHGRKHTPRRQYTLPHEEHTW